MSTSTVCHMQECWSDAHDIFLVLQRLSGSSFCRQSRTTHVNSEWRLCFSAPCSSLAKHFLVPTYVTLMLEEITLSKGSQNVNQALVSQTSSILSTLSKETAKLECQSSSVTYSIIIKVPFCKFETRKISYILSCVRGPTLATIPAVLWFHTVFVVCAQTPQGASLQAPLVHVFIFRSSPSRQASLLRCITLNVSRLPVQSRVSDDACEACLARVALQLKRHCCHSFRPSHKVA